MLPSKGYVKSLNCPYHQKSDCNTPHCHFRHVGRDDIFDSSSFNGSNTVCAPPAVNAYYKPTPIAELKKQHLPVNSIPSTAVFPIDSDDKPTTYDAELDIRVVRKLKNRVSLYNTPRPPQNHLKKPVKLLTSEERLMEFRRMKSCENNTKPKICGIPNVQSLLLEKQRLTSGGSGVKPKLTFEEKKLLYMQRMNISIPQQPQNVRLMQFRRMKSCENNTKPKICGIPNVQSLLLEKQRLTSGGSGVKPKLTFEEKKLLYMQRMNISIPQQPQNVGGEEWISLKLMGIQATMEIIIKKDSPLRRLMNLFSEIAMLQMRAVRFRFDGQPINESDTPRSLEMDDGDIIDVDIQEIGGGHSATNSKRKL